MVHNSVTLQKAFRYLFEEEIYALKKLAMMLPKDPHVVNIGAGAGTSGLALLESRDDLLLHTIDIQDISSPLGCLEAERDVVGLAGMIDRLKQTCGDSKDVGRNWLKSGKSMVDMVFVDGAHSYDNCKSDIYVWGKNIKNGGIIAIHDYKKDDVFKTVKTEYAPHPVAWHGVDKAVDEFIIKGNNPILHVKSLIAFMVKND